jgi:hypothetical protein
MLAAAGHNRKYGCRTGTSASDPSAGSNPPGTAGTSTVAGHDPYALYIDAFGTNASITDVYVHDNTLQNQSQYYLTPSNGIPTWGFRLQVVLFCHSVGPWWVQRGTSSPCAIPVDA